MRQQRSSRWFLAVRATVFVACALVGLATSDAAPQGRAKVLRFATTTSTADTGLLAAILPSFEKQCGCRVDVIAVGTGQALAMGRQGDVDVVLVHARRAEDQFVADGHARARTDVMYNDFVIVGPVADPAKVSGLARAREAFAAVAKAAVPFASRGDKSGTHTVELGIWSDLGLTPAAPWYRAIGQGMGETLMAANEMGAYTISDRATWLATSAKVPNLRLLVGGARLSENRDQSLRNYYGVLAVNPDKHPGVKFDLATMFVTWITSAETQRVIGDFGVARFGQSLFYPDSEDYKATHQVTVKSGGRSVTLKLADLAALPKHSLSGYSVIGVKKGVLGPYTWTGASLKDVLLKADPTLAQPHHAGSRILVRSSDGWMVTVWWDELFAAIPRGFGIYNAKGCNECHGVLGEGSAPRGKRPAPALAEAGWPADAVEAALRAGGAKHANMMPFTPAQLSRAELDAMLDWLTAPRAKAAGQRFIAPSHRTLRLLAYERDRKAMGGAEGLIQLVIGPDEYASRYSHWVTDIEIIK